MKYKKVTYEEALDLADLLKNLAQITNNENLIDADKNSELPKNIIKLLNVLTNNYDWDKQDNFAKAMASVLLSETVRGLTAEELMDGNNNFFKEKYYFNIPNILKLEIIK